MGRALRGLIVYEDVELGHFLEDLCDFSVVRIIAAQQVGRVVDGVELASEHGEQVTSNGAPRPDPILSLLVKFGSFCEDFLSFCLHKGTISLRKRDVNYNRKLFYQFL